MAASAASIALQLQKLSNEATEKSFAYNTQEANTARAWQKEMSDTSHQREVKDLIKAGLNPVLSSGGSGAQSYTTSSASAQAENAANAVGNVWSSQIGADATRQAAAASAAATRYAAAQQASAAKYAAALQYQAQIKGYANQKEINAATNKSNQKVAEIQNQKSLWGNIRQMFEANGVKNSDFKNVANTAQMIRNDNNGKYLLNKDKGLSFNNLNWRGKQFLQNQLRKTGLTVSLSNQRLAYNALIAQDGKSVSLWHMYVNQNNQKKNSAKSRLFNKTGSGVW